MSIIAGILAGGASALSSASGSAAQKYAADKTARSNKELAEYQYSKDLEMWERQRQSNLDLWNMQNQYNSPASQMSRYRDAGLNPNLIYGQQNVSGPVKSPEIAKYQAPRVEYPGINYAQALPAMIAGYQDFQMKQAQVDNLQAQNPLIKRQSLLTARKAEGELHRASGAISEAQIKRFLAEYQPDMLREDLRGKTLENQKRHEDIIAKQLENQLRKEGFTSSDQWYFRVLARMLIQLGFMPSDILKQSK